MESVSNVLIVLIVILTPRVLLYLTARYKIFNVLGTVFMSYAVGFILSFVFKERSVATTMSELMVPIAIPLILFSSDFKSMKRLSRQTLKSFSLAIIAAAAACVAGFFIFKDSVPNAAETSGMLIGLYTGGTPNLIAIGLSLGVSSTDIGITNTADLIAGGIYFFLLITVMPKLVAAFLPPFRYEGGKTDEGTVAERLENEFVPSTRPFSIKRFVNRIPTVLLSVACVAVAAGIALLTTGSLNAAVVFLVVTTLGIALSFVPKVQDSQNTFSSGQYFIYMFSLAIGLSFDITAINSKTSLVFLMLFTVQTMTVLIHLVLAKLTKVDGPTTLITSTAGVYGPAFIVPVANALKNKEIILPGLLCGILGYAIGNYLGIGLATLLSLWG